MDLRTQKQQARHAVAERLAKLDAQERAAESRSICRRIKENLPKGTLLICAFHPMKSEVNLLPLIDELIGLGHTVALPRGEGRGFAFRIPTNMQSLLMGSFNVPEPTVDDAVAQIEDIDLVLLPGIAFDPTGGRLGRGNGGFDTFMTELRKKNQKAVAWGICFDCQVLNSVPMEAHDMRVDAVVTPRGIISSQEH